MGRDGEGGFRAKQDYSIVESANWYSYISNSPLTCIDITGCDDITLGVAFDVAAGGNGIRVSGVAVGVGIVLDTDVLSDSGFYLTSEESMGWRSLTFRHTWLLSK